jgi:hypothetical protein
MITLELECPILTTLYFAGAKNTDSWRTKKGDLKCAFPLDIPMVHSSTLAVSTDSEHLTCSGFFLSKTDCFGSLEFVTDCFSNLSLSPRRNDSGATFMGSTHSGPPSPLRAMIEVSTEEFYMASSREGDSILPSSQRQGTGASPAPVTTSPWLEDASATQAMMTVPPLTLAPRSDIAPPLSNGVLFGRGNKHEPVISKPTPSMRQHNGEAISPASKQLPWSGRTSHHGTSPRSGQRGSCW